MPEIDEPTRKPGAKPTGKQLGLRNPMIGESIRNKGAQPADEVKTLIALLNEYTDKLNRLGDDGQPARREILNRLSPVAQQLARFASQKIEHEGLDELMRLELQLRLAEFEA